MDTNFMLLHSFVRLLRNVSAIGECVRQKTLSDSRGESTIAEVAWIKTELSDCAIAVLRMAQVLGIDYNELVELGFERNKECLSECGDCDSGCYETKEENIEITH